MMKEYNINQTTLRILGLYRSDYRRPLHLREVARETGVDVKAVQLQLKRLEKISVLSSAARGRSKDYSLNFNDPLTMYYMVLAEAFTTTEYLARNFVIKKLASETRDRVDGTMILFGGFARGEATEGSPIDLLIITGGAMDSNIFAETGSLISREIRVKSMDKAWFLEGFGMGDPLITEAVSNHILMKGMDEFCSLMWQYHAKKRT